MSSSRRCSRPFGVYLHVPYCASRCGYCDFNTYALRELGQGASPQTWSSTVLAELGLLLERAERPPPPVSTVFFGGGTPSLLPAEDLVEVLSGIGEMVGLQAEAEVTVEANPESVSASMLRALRAGGVTRLSLGMQSARPHVLAVLDRQHTPGRVAAAVAEARGAGFDQVSLDLIYATPGESLADWGASLEQVLALHPEHVSAYSLIVEEGTRLAARVRRGELPDVDDDAAADCYLLAEEVLSQAGYRWYEVSNWSVDEQSRCRHNLGYWLDGDWWGLGPGAHSHVDGVRWWNVKHPASWTGMVSSGRAPTAGQEYLDPDTLSMERVMLRLRTVEGLFLAELDPGARTHAHEMAGAGLLDANLLAEGRLRLTLPGRLMADHVVRRLV